MAFYFKKYFCFRLTSVYSFYFRLCFVLLRSLYYAFTDIFLVFDFSYFADAGLTKLTDLDLFGARISDSGTKSLRCMLKDPSPPELWMTSSFGHLNFFFVALYFPK